MSPELGKAIQYGLGTDRLLLLTVVLDLILLLLILFAFWRIARLSSQTPSRRGTALTGSELHRDQRTALSEVVSALEELAAAGKEEREMIRNCVQKVGIVRFNAFDDIGSNLSFSAALLDAKGDGIVITSIYGRDESRTYAKPLIQFDSPYPLSEEELEAISQARGGGVRANWSSAARKARAVDRPDPRLSRRTKDER